MPRMVWPLLAGILVLLTPALAAAQGVEIQSGQKIVGVVDEPGDVQVMRFPAIRGDRVTIKFKVPRKSPLEPVLQLLGPGGEVDLPPVEKGKFVLKKWEVPDTGLYLFVVYGAGTVGEYAFSFAIKRAKIPPVTIAAGEKSVFFAPAGAKITILVTAEKGSDVSPGINHLYDPQGQDVRNIEFLKESKRKAKLVVPEGLHFGQYILHTAARSGAGNVVVKVKVKPPRPEVRKLSDANAFESMVLLAQAPDGQGGFSEWLRAEVRGPSVKSVILKFPPGRGLSDATLTEDPFDPGEFRYEMESAYPDGLYTLVVTRRDGSVAAREFSVYGRFPDPLLLTVTNGDSRRPQVSWTGGGGALLYYLAVLEYDAGEDDWDDEYSVLLPGDATSHTPPDGPLDPVPHGVMLWAISPGLRVTVGEFLPESN